MSVSTNNPDYDVIVVGGGHNGLSAGCFLANDGKRVLIVEATERVGGMASSYYAIPEAPNHLVHPCALDLLSWRAHTVGDELELEKYGFRQIELSPSYVYLHPDGQSLVLWRDYRKTAEEIRKYSTNDADAYLEFMELINALLDIIHPMTRVDPTQRNLMTKWGALKALRRHKHLKSDLLALFTGSAYQAAKERFEHPITISAMTCLTGAAGLVTADGSGIYYSVLGFLHRFGIGRSIGGTGKIPEAMAARFHAHGGEVMTSSPVDEIVVKDGRAVGIRLKSGETLTAKAVISTCHPKMTMDMATPGAFSKKLMTRVSMVPSNASGGSPLKVDLALNGQISVPRHQAMRADGLDLRGPVLLIGTDEAVLENFASAARGEVPKLPWMWIATPSAVDPSQAPAGQDVVYLYPPAMPVNPAGGWDAVREHAVSQTIEHASRYVEGLKTMEIGRRVETSADLAQRMNVLNGCVLHLDVSIFRSSAVRPAAGLGGETLPVTGLYFGGSGIHPGGGVTGMPGKIAANRVKRFLKK